jgi:hypothetical protein
MGSFLVLANLILYKLQGHFKGRDMHTSKIDWVCADIKSTHTEPSECKSENSRVPP